MRENSKRKSGTGLEGECSILGPLVGMASSIGAALLISAAPCIINASLSDRADWSDGEGVRGC